MGLARIGQGARRQFARPRFGPLLGALTFWVLSLWPTLLPRSWFVQGAVSGLCAAIGWLLGILGGHVVHLALRRTGHPPSKAVRSTAWRALPVVAGVVGVVMLVLWWRWQNDQRDVMGMGSVSIVSAIPVVLVSAIVLALLVSIGRAIAWVVRWIDRRASRILRPVWGRIATAIVVVAIIVVGINAGSREFVDWADRSFGAVNEGTPDDAVEPTSPLISGSPDSLVDWDTLGYQGRDFAGTAPTGDDIAAFAGSPDGVLDPIRVYVGLDSRPTIAERVDLAMAELERTGAFDREVLVVATATGTGWINPNAAATLEYMHGGDTAIVSMQYSFFPSWVAFVIDPAIANDAGRDLFAAVRDRWLELPADERPKLIAFGESLGSFGSESAFHTGDLAESLAAISEQTDGALFVGPTTSNDIYQQLVDERDAGSPTWRPTYEAAPGLRVANTVDKIDPDDESWTGSRTLYLHHPTDAVGTWSASTIWSPPGWAEHPLGVGVATQVRWFPFVTWVQETADLMAGFSAVPGFGHDYRDALTASWAAVVPPDGWTEADTDQLQAFLGLG